jgi:glycosyltransferase involved in cell wall biosynthesis
MQLFVAVCILAKDEEQNIGAVLRQLVRQSLMLDASKRVMVHVVANGCTDKTVTAAKACSSLFNGKAASLQVHDLPQGGKSRSWNRTVHELVDSYADYMLFLDADISFADDLILSELLERLEDDPRVEVCAGYPVKDVERKTSKSVLDLISLKLSSNTRHIDAISGQLYAARAATLRTIWLPDATPGEDGFLNAMVNTTGFSRRPVPGRVVGHRRPTHYFESLGPIAFMQHERRLIIGTIINRWIFEHLWSLKLSTAAGPLIRDWNRDDPEWVERLIRKRVGRRTWLIPSAILFGRLNSNQARPLVRRLAFLPLALAATVATLPPSISANRRLKQRGSASTW